MPDLNDYKRRLQFLIRETQCRIDHRIHTVLNDIFEDCFYNYMEKLEVLDELKEKSDYSQIRKFLTTLK